MTANVWKGQLEISGPQRDQVSTRLEEAAAKRNQEEDVPEAKAELDRTARIRQANVLWVDDNPDGNLRESLMLQDLGLCIAQATSTEAALEYLDLGHGRYHLIITDLTRDNDPEAGLTLLRSLHKKGFKQPVIVYAFSPGNRAELARELGATHVTVTPAELLTAVLQVLRS